MNRLIALVIVSSGLAMQILAQTTNLIEWQTNWPSGSGTGALVTNQFDLPYSSSWFSSPSAQCVGTANGDNTATNLINYNNGSSVTFWTYFAPTNTPVTLAPGKTLQVTMNFNLVGTASQNASRGLRIGLLYAGTNNGAGQMTYDNGSPRQTNYWGYCQVMNFGTTFGVAPLQMDCFTNGVTNTDAIISKSGDGVQIGSNSGGTTNDPGFEDGANYTMVMSISENSPTNVSITTTFYGSTLSNSVAGTPGFISQTVTDTNFCYTNFDTFCMRPAEQQEVSTEFIITSFQVQIITALSAPPPIKFNYSGGALNLSWASSGWWLQAQTNSLTGGLGDNWVDVSGSTTVTSESIPVNPGNGSVFFRLSPNP